MELPKGFALNQAERRIECTRRCHALYQRVWRKQRKGAVA